MRTLGRPAASTVASDIAVGSRGSLRAASSNHAANNRSGSSAAVKSPVVNQVGCSIGADSDILWRSRVVGSVPSSRSRRLRYRGTSRGWHAALRHLPLLALALAASGCSFSYQLDSMFAKDASVPWENPHTGARGTITPLATATSQDGVTCRDFLASYVKNGSESWLHGEACRAGRGKWEVRNLRPWKNT